MSTIMLPEAGADRRRHGLFDEIHLAHAGGLRRLADGAFFDLGDAGRDADHDPRVNELFAVMHLLNEEAQHLFGGVEVGDDAVFERSDGEDIAGRAAEHLLGLDADRQDLPEVAVDRNHRGFAQDNATPSDVN
jgi:hypothetical protein